jgi:DNA polymerase elongation subunit (family B)
MTIDTGEWVEPPTLEVTGLDIVRSDKAAITSEILNDVLMEILSDKNESEIKSDVYEIINDTYEAAQHNEIPLAKLARPRGMSKSAAKYGTPEKTPQPVYHADRECPHLRQKTASFTRVHVDNIDPEWRECDYCRYADLPEL